VDALDHDEMLELGQDSEESVSDDDAPPSTVKNPTFIHHNMFMTLTTTPAHTCCRASKVFDVKFIKVKYVQGRVPKCI
jgi:hypothetical protein